MFDDVVDFSNDMAFALAFFIGVRNDFCDTERVGMEGCLRYEAIREGDSEKTGDASGEAEEEEIPVEASRFAERELGALGNQG